jgi:hypothetical protein
MGARRWRIDFQEDDEIFLTVTEESTRKMIIDDRNNRLCSYTQNCGLIVTSSASSESLINTNYKRKFASFSHYTACPKIFVSLYLYN